MKVKQTPTTLLLSADFLLVATRIELIYMHTTVHVQSPLAAAAWPALPSRKLYQAKHQRTLQRNTTMVDKPGWTSSQITVMTMIQNQSCQEISQRYLQLQLITAHTLFQGRCSRLDLLQQFCSVSILYQNLHHLQSGHFSKDSSL